MKEYCGALDMHNDPPERETASLKDVDRLVAEIWVVDEYGCLLLTQRAPAKSHPLQWQCPGCTVPAGESAKDALCRKLEEETGIRLHQTPSFLGRFFHETAKSFVDVYAVEQKRPSAPIRPQEGKTAGVQWVAPSRLQTLADAGEVVPHVWERYERIRSRLLKMTTLMDERLCEVRPSERQRLHQKREFYGFIHFGMNSFTNREWGDGSESESLFAPDALDTDQWAFAAKDAGMSGLILTAKHHDGFCLWPSALTEHSVKNAAVKTDVVKSLSESCRKAGIGFGVYLSPWDRNHPSYGQGRPYDDVFVQQLTELCSNYGELFCVWFDGACGEGPNGKKQIYDWERYYAAVRSLQPNACICVCGPDIRWCGNEAGRVRENEWSVVPERLRLAERIQQESQQEDGKPPLRSQEADLGSRNRLRGEEDLIWYPAEVNVSIRPGWFHHPEEDDQVKSAERLFLLYLSSVGGNASFLLNLPPDRHGRLHENDCAALHALGEKLRSAFSCDLAQSASIESAPNSRILRWEDARTISYVQLFEDTQYGQRIERYALYADDAAEPFFRGGAVGARKYIRLQPPMQLRSLRLEIEDSRGDVHLAPIRVF